MIRLPDRATARWSVALRAFLLAQTLGCADMAATVTSDPVSSLAIARMVLNENSVPTIELGDDGTIVNLLRSRPGPVIQHRCGPQVLQVEFLRSNGQRETLVSRESHRLEMSTENAAIARFERWDQFAGNLQGRALGTTRLRVSLITLADSATVFGPFYISVDVLEVDRDPC